MDVDLRANWHQPRANLCLLKDQCQDVKVFQDQRLQIVNVAMIHKILWVPLLGSSAFV